MTSFYWPIRVRIGVRVRVRKLSLEYPWISMDIHGQFPWTISMDNFHGYDGYTEVPGSILLKRVSTKNVHNNFPRGIHGQRGYEWIRKRRKPRLTKTVDVQRWKGISMDIHNGYPFMSMDIFLKCPWSIHGCPWIIMDIHGYPWISMAGVTSTNMDIHGYPFVSIYIHGYPFFCTLLYFLLT